ncbi:hypothetical protein THRCLA_00923 [Thraustotheca clavata]|uniref:carnosine N-methyltransferase n=1 Tax=Thraustotheca clavata TaxID=74557 RepID=A0A1W0A9T3_9STRA|nr:hypothetical protein THRCLA_00923 [Thraustotheca clavata]
MDKEELEHYTEVLLSMKEYEGFVWREGFRKKQHLKQLSEHHLKYLPPETVKDNITSLLRCAKKNQEFWDDICEMQKRFGPEVQLPAHVNFKQPLKTPYRHYSKLKSTLHQCVRDWAEEGAEERERCYKPLLDALERALPVTKENKFKQKVLVPGAGLGRLALEIVSRGYVTEGNEFSYQMLFTSNFILNCASQPNSITLHPWIDNPSNVISFKDFSRPVTIPDVSPAQLLDFPSGDENYFSMCAGEFLEVYSRDVGVWDSIVTCFFIDAAPNVIEYIEAIERMLKPGGVWINLGPLLYHWQNGSGEEDERYDQSIELTYEEIKHVAKSLNFTITLILAKKGPLGQVWLAAHWDKKLTKAAIAAADVGEAADSIANPVVPLALRVSGHLLLGVTRIYSRKVGYLFTDCSEALVKIKMAFRPGVVDLPEQHHTASSNAINVTTFGEFDPQMPYDIQSITAPSMTEWMITPSTTVARRQDITLADSSSRSLTQDSSFGAKDSFGNNDSFGGADWHPFDIDDQVNNELDTSSISDVERGRNVANTSGLSIRPDLDNSIDNLDKDDIGVDLFQDDKPDIEMGDPEVPDIAADDVSMPDIDMQPVDDQFSTGGIDVEPASPLPNDSQSLNFAVDTSGILATVPEQPKRQRKRKIGQDSMTELSSSVIKKGLKDVSDIVRVRGNKRLKLDNKQPVDDLLVPSTKCLSANLLGMFKVTMKHAKLPDPNATHLQEEEDATAIERTRRQSGQTKSYNEIDEDEDLAVTTEQKDSPDFEFGGPQDEEPHPDMFDNGLDVDAEPSIDEEVAGPDGLAIDLDLSLAVTSAPPTPSVQTTTVAEHKWHPHTVKVMKVLRKSMHDKDSVSYSQLAKTTRSRRTAAALFFEVLQLKTLDFIDVEQTQSFGNIQISKTNHFADYIPAVDGQETIAGNSYEQFKLFFPMSKEEYCRVKARLRHECSQRRIRLEEFMKTFDVHKTKKVSAEQFTRAIDASGIRLSKEEIGLLIAKYRLPEDAKLVDYRRFCDLIDKSYTAKDLEKKYHKKLSLDTVKLTQGGTFVKKALSSETELNAFRSIIEHLTRAGIVLKDVFHDFDKNNSGFVTKARFVRDLFGILGDVDPIEVDVLTKVYGAGVDVNYKLLHHDLTNGIFPSSNNNNNSSSPRSRRRGGNQLSSIDAESVEGPLREIAARDRIRVKNFFIDYDRMRSGKCTEAQFMRAVKVCFGALTQSDLDVLVAKYSCGIVDVSNERKVDYIAFCKSIAAGTEEEIDSSPLSIDVPILPTAICSREIRGALNDDELKEWQVLMTRLSFPIKTRRILLKPVFCDFDKGKTECVTCEQFTRVLAIFNLFVNTDAEKRVILKRYASSRLNTAPISSLAFDSKAFINYKTFCLDMDEFQCPKPQIPSTPVIAPKIDQVEIATVERTLPMLLRYIKQKAKRDRIRMEEYFRDFDRLRKGKITRNQLAGGLSSAGFVLSNADIDLLVAEFSYFDEKDVEGNSMVAWTRLADEIDAVFTIKGLEREPSKDVAHTIEMAANAISDMNFDANDEETITNVLRTMVGIISMKRLDIKPPFEDFDHSNQGFISHTKFERVLSVYNLLPSQAPIARLLCIKFSERGNAPQPGVSSMCDVNYRALLNALEMIKDNPNTTHVPGAKEFRLLQGNNNDNGNSNINTRRHKQPPSAVQLASLLKDIRQQVDAKRIRLKQFFAESDRLRTGDITIAKFHTAINRCGLIVDGNDVLTLNEAFRSNVRPDQINYRLFIQAIESTPFHEEECDTSPKSPQLVSLLSRLHSLVHFKRYLHFFSILLPLLRLHLKPYFEDYDHNSLLAVTKTQFAAVLDLMRLECTPNDLNLLCNHYAVQHTRTSTSNVHYLRFLHDLDSS